MRAKTKTVLKGFNYMHCDDFAKYLGDMAAEGWHFKEWSAGLKFEKGEPEHAVYAVEVFTKATDDDMRPEPRTQEFAEYCEAAGWKFIDAKQKFCIFKKADADALELFTPEERIENVKKSMFSGSNSVLTVLYGLNALLQWIMLFTTFENNIFSPSSLYGIIIWNVLFLGQIGFLISALWQMRKLKKDLEEGKEIYFGHCRDGKYHLNYRSVYVVALLLLMMLHFSFVGQMEKIIVILVVITLTIGFAVIINKVRPERDMNVLIQVGFSIMLVFTAAILTMTIFQYSDEDKTLDKKELPLLISDYREHEDKLENVMTYKESNILGSARKYHIFEGGKYLYYYIYKSEHDVILDKLWEEIFEKNKFNEGSQECASDWGAQKAMQNDVGTYYVRYENVLFVFSDGDDSDETYVALTGEQIKNIREKLDLK